MRLLLDMQCLQTPSRLRGIGRYSLSLARAMAGCGGRHQFEALLNGAIGETIHEARTSLTDFIAPELIHVWQPPAPIDRFTPECRWRKAAGLELRQYVIEGIGPDVMYTMSLFESADAITPVTVPTVTKAVTQYDLVPLLNAKEYLTDPLTRRSYDALLDNLRMADVLLAISDYSRREAMDALGIPGDRIVAISGDADPLFRPLALEPRQIDQICGRLGINRDFVLYTGNTDPRKNLHRLIAAYALLPAEVRNAHQLVVVSGFNEEQLYHVAKARRRYGVTEQELRLVGRVDDETLVTLYNACAAFVFPSLHEGFGLPVLEAMRCGAAVVASNTTSIPEVMGLDAALFDPKSPASIAEKLAAVLTDDGWRQALKTHAAEQSRRFSWEASGRRAVEALEAAHDRKRQAEGTRIGFTQSNRRLSLGIVADGAAPAFAWFEALAERYAIDLVVEADSALPRPVYRLTGEAWLAKAPCYDRRLYVVGSGDRRLITPELLERYPGALLLTTVASAAASESTAGVIALHASGGWAAVRRATSPLPAAEGGSSGLRDRPWPAPSLPLLQAAQGIIVLTPAVAGEIEYRYGPLFEGAVAVMTDSSAQTWAETLERFAEHHPLGRRRRLLDALSRLGRPPSDAADRAVLAVAIDEATLRLRPQQLLIDVSEIARADHRGGIERIVRALLFNLLDEMPAHWRVEPVRREGNSYVYARDFMASLLGCSPAPFEEPLAEVRPGDIFLSTGHEAGLASKRRDWLGYHALRGMRTVFGLADLSGLTLPDNPLIRDLLANWLKMRPALVAPLTCGPIDEGPSDHPTGEATRPRARIG